MPVECPAERSTPASVGRRRRKPSVLAAGRGRCPRRAECTAAPVYGRAARPPDGGRGGAGPVYG